jgi:hypothetical protein
MTCPIRDNNLIKDETDNSDNSDDESDDTDTDTDDDDPILQLNLTPDEMRRYAQWLCDLEYAIFCHFQKE